MGKSSRHISESSVTPPNFVLGDVVRYHGVDYQVDDEAFLPIDPELPNMSWSQVDVNQVERVDSPLSLSKRADLKPGDVVQKGKGKGREYFEVKKVDEEKGIVDVRDQEWKSRAFYLDEVEKTDKEMPYPDRPRRKKKASTGRIIYSLGFPYGAPLVMLRGGGTKHPDAKAIYKGRFGFVWDSVRYAWTSYMYESDFIPVLQALQDAGFEVLAKKDLDDSYLVEGFEKRAEQKMCPVCDHPQNYHFDGGLYGVDATSCYGGGGSCGCNAAIAAPEDRWKKWKPWEKDSKVGSRFIGKTGNPCPFCGATSYTEKRTGEQICDGCGEVLGYMTPKKKLDPWVWNKRQKNAIFRGIWDSEFMGETFTENLQGQRPVKAICEECGNEDYLKWTGKCEACHERWKEQLRTDSDSLLPAADHWNAPQGQTDLVKTYARLSKYGCVECQGSKECQACFGRGGFVTEASTWASCGACDGSKRCRCQRQAQKTVNFYEDDIGDCRSCGAEKILNPDGYCRACKSKTAAYWVVRDDETEEEIGGPYREYENAIKAMGEHWADVPLKVKRDDGEDTGDHLGSRTSAYQDEWYCYNCDYSFEGRGDGKCMGCGSGMDSPDTLPMYEVRQRDQAGMKLKPRDEIAFLEDQKREKRRKKKAQIDPADEEFAVGGAWCFEHEAAELDNHRGYCEEGWTTDSFPCDIVHSSEEYHERQYGFSKKKYQTISDKGASKTSAEMRPPKQHFCEEIVVDRRTLGTLPCFSSIKWVLRSTKDWQGKSLAEEEVMYVCGTHKNKLLKRHGWELIGPYREGKQASKSCPRCGETDITYEFGPAEDRFEYSCPNGHHWESKSPPKQAQFNDEQIEELARQPDTFIDANGAQLAVGDSVQIWNWNDEPSEYPPGRITELDVDGDVDGDGRPIGGGYAVVKWHDGSEETWVGSWRGSYYEGDWEIDELVKVSKASKQAQVEYDPWVKRVDELTGELTIICPHCDSVQAVEPAGPHPEGWIYGSGADYCDSCGRAFDGDYQTPSVKQVEELVPFVPDTDFSKRLNTTVPSEEADATS